MNIYILALCIVLFRYFFIPYGDQPDLTATIPEYIPDLMQREIFSLAQSTPNLSTDNPISQLLFGSFYDSYFQHPSPFLFLISSIPYLSLSFFLSISNSLYSHHIKPFLRRASFALLLLPSTSYYLITVKSEAIINVLALLFVYNFLIISYLTPYKSRFAYKLKKILPLFLLFFPLSIASYYLLEDNQSVIFSFFIILGLLCYLAKPISSYFEFPQSLSLSPVVRVRALISFGLIILILITLSSVVYVLPYIYDSITFLLPNTAFENISTQSLLNQDVMYKYPFVFRPIILLSCFIFSSADGYSVQILSKLLLLLLLFKYFLRFARQRRFAQDLTFSIFSVLVVLISLSVFPGYANYKYWIFLTPVFLNPFCFYPTSAPLILISLIYAELVFRLFITAI